MRSLFCLLFVSLLAGCPGSLEPDKFTGGDDGNGSGSGAGGGIPTECFNDSQCQPAGAKCCDCPTHAVPTNDPTYAGCNEVACQPMSCGSPMKAVCQVGQCELVCAPVACDASLSCANGFATDANGCLTCTCAAPAVPTQCAADGDCARVKEDCCGCMAGGRDTAIPQGEVSTYESGLNCSPNPVCPGGDSCPADLAARCVQGECALVSGLLPQNACGRADLPACAGTDLCTVNANDQATMYGVGVCQP